MEKPLLSVVAMARNDDYGGNWTNRINAFLKVLAYQAQRTKLSTEMVFVEYNPVENKPFLYESLIIPKNEYFKTRFFVVPKEFHQSLPDSEKVPICEFIAKNIGMRRSQGEWIIATNPDVIYGNELFDFFANKKMDSRTFYRVNRSDLSVSMIPSEMTAPEILTHASGKTIKIMYNDGTTYVSWKEWFSALLHGRSQRIFLQCPALNHIFKRGTDSSIMHTNAAGDFLMMHRTALNDSRGYDEITVGSGVLDGYILYILYCKGYQQTILPYSLYHIYHHHKGVKYLASHEKFKQDAAAMIKNKIPYKEYSPNWGFPDHNFKEIVF